MVQHGCRQHSRQWRERRFYCTAKVCATQLAPFCIENPRRSAPSPHHSAGRQKCRTQSYLPSRQSPCEATKWRPRAGARLYSDHVPATVLMTRHLLLTTTPSRSPELQQYRRCLNPWYPTLPLHDSLHGPDGAAASIFSGSPAVSSAGSTCSHTTLTASLHGST